MNPLTLKHLIINYPNFVITLGIVNILASRNCDSGAAEGSIPYKETAFD